MSSCSLSDSDDEKGSARQEEFGNSTSLGELCIEAPVLSRSKSGVSDTERSIAHQKSGSVEGVGSGGVPRGLHRLGGDVDLVVSSVGAWYIGVSTGADICTEGAFPGEDLLCFRASTVPALRCPCPLGL